MIIKERTKVVVKEVAAILFALGITVILSRTVFTFASPVINKQFIDQVGGTTRTFVAAALKALSGTHAQTTTVTAPATPALRPDASVQQDKEKLTTSVVFPKEYLYKLGDDGVYR